MPYGVLNDGLDAQGKDQKITGLYVVVHLEFFAQPHLFDINVGFDIAQFLGKRYGRITGHRPYAASEVSGKISQKLRSILRILQHDLLDGAQGIIQKMGLHLAGEVP